MTDSTIIATWFLRMTTSLIGASISLDQREPTMKAYEKRVFFLFLSFPCISINSFIQQSQQSFFFHTFDRYLYLYFLVWFIFAPLSHTVSPNSFRLGYLQVQNRVSSKLSFRTSNNEIPLRVLAPKCIQGNKKSENHTVLLLFFIYFLFNLGWKGLHLYPSYSRSNESRRKWTVCSLLNHFHFISTTWLVLVYFSLALISHHQKLDASSTSRDNHRIGDQHALRPQL